MWGIGVPELIIIFIIVLLLFGAKKIPELARSLGSGISEFKKGISSKVTEANDNVPKNDTAEKKAE